MIATSDEKNKYSLPGKGLEILKKIHNVEEMHNLSENERFLLLFLRTQLEENWEIYCLQLLDTLITNKQKTSNQRWGKLKGLTKKWWNPKGI